MGVLACDCEVYEICPSCAPTPQAYTKAAAAYAAPKAMTDTYIASVLLLCVECQQPIKATITTAQWVKVEWISPDGTCQACWNLKKQEVRDERGTKV